MATQEKKNSAEDIELSSYQQSIICLIVHDVQQAVTTFETNDMKEALESVKRIKQADGELDVKIMTVLKHKYDMKFVWGVIDSSTHKEKRLALLYNGIAFQVD